MIESLAIQQHHEPAHPRTSRAIDTAVGILVGLRRCGTRAAFTELLSASERHDMSTFKLASALVTLASGSSDGETGVTAARLAVEKEWGSNYWP